MNSALKVVGPIVLVLVVVFGATLISQYTPPDKPKKESGTQIVGQPLEFRATEMGYNPTAEDVAARAFDAFHEPGGDPVYVSFWFTNPHPVPVKLTVTGRSCSSCTAASAAIVPQDRIQAIAQRVASGLVPSAGNLLAAVGAVELDRGLTWQPLDFEHTDRAVEVPAAADPETPTVGIFRMHITVSVEGPKKLHAMIGMAAGDQPPVQLPFTVSLLGVPPVLIHPRDIKLGEMSEGTPPRTVDVYFWSTTRDAAALPPPAVAVAVPTPFLELGTPSRLSSEEAQRLAVRLAGEGVVTRVQAAYRVPVTVYRQVPSTPSGGPSEPDIGPFERRVGFAGPNGSTATLTITGSVAGVVALDGGIGQVSLGSFSARAGTRKTVSIVSNRPDLNLEVLAAEHQPAFLKAELGTPVTEAGRRHWSLTVTVPEGAGSGPLPAGATIALRATGPHRNQKVHIPVTGQGVTR